MRYWWPNAVASNMSTRGQVQQVIRKNKGKRGHRKNEPLLRFYEEEDVQGQELSEETRIVDVGDSVQEQTVPEPEVVVEGSNNSSVRVTSSLDGKPIVVSSGANPVDELRAVSVDSVLAVPSNPFKCGGCGVVYSSTATSDIAPTLLPCRHTLCVRCLTSQRRKANDMNEFIIQCRTCHTFPVVAQDPLIFIALIDVIKEIEEKSVQSFFSSSVNIESGELTSMKCGGCKVSYSSHSSKNWPYVTNCGHILCKDCAEKKKRIRSTKERKLSAFMCQHKLQCVQCFSVDVYQDGVMFSPIEEVIKWLDIKKGEQVNADPRDQFNCTNCEQKTLYDRGFLCTDCSKRRGKQILLCGFCTYDDVHKGHSKDVLLPLKLQSVKDECRKKVLPKVVQTSLEANAVRKVHRKLLTRVEKRFSTVIDNIPMATKCSDATAHAFHLNKISSSYASLLEHVIIPRTKESNQYLENILKCFDDEFWGIAGVDGESGGDIETERDRIGESVEEPGEN